MLFVCQVSRGTVNHTAANATLLHKSQQFKFDGLWGGIETRRRAENLILIIYEYEYSLFCHKCITIFVQFTNTNITKKGIG